MNIEGQEQNDCSSSDDLWAQFFLPCKAGTPIDDSSARAKPAPVNVERKKETKETKEKKEKKRKDRSDKRFRKGEQIRQA